jgi:ribosomal protein S18 acetylase RimI-like enzyme
MTFEIVRITPSTARVLDRVAEDVFDSAIRPDRLAAYLAQPTHLLAVAVSEGVVVGQVRGVILHNPDEPAAFFVENAGVTPCYQRQGIASALFRDVTNWAREKGCPTFWVATEADNDGACEFYRSLGLRETPVKMFDNEDG